MLKKYILLLTLLFIVPFANCQNTIVLQPDATLGKDAFISDNVPNGGQGNSSELDAGAWTINGIPLKIRGLINFDLSTVPSGATIESAVLTLYNNPNSQNGNANGQHVHSNGSNTALLQRITSPWTENVSWNTQPTTTSVNQVILPQDTDPFQNYQLDVKLLLQDILANPSEGYGFLLKLQDETPYRLLAFASSDHPNASLHPKLEIVFSYCTTIQPNAISGKDAFISDNVPTGGQGNSPEFDAAAWTISGTPLKIRGLLDFDLSSIPSSATIESAVLTLYNNPNSQNGNANGQHVHTSGSNAAYLKRITSPWTEENVSWNSQPSTTALNQVTLPQDTNPFQDYNVDVKLLIQDIIANPSQGYGLMLQLQNESPYRLVAFASSDHPDASLHPKLKICYTPTLATTNPNLLKQNIILYPNPSSGIFTMQTSNFTADGPQILFTLYDTLGKKVFEKLDSTSSILKYNISNLQNGLYYWTVTSGNNRNNGKLILAK